MKKNIVIVGLIYDENLGDQAIALSTTEIINDYCVNVDAQEFEIKYLDLTGAISRNTDDNKRNKSILKQLYMKIAHMVNRIAPRTCHYLTERKIVKRFTIVANETITEMTKAIIFCGGGIIQYKHLYTSKPISIITDLAEKMDIPIMFSAVGIEGYDDKNYRCRLLKKAMNSVVVKTITTRDDYKCLVDKYITNPSIRTAKVADSVCGICSFIPSQITGDNTIGLGIANPRLFKKYGIPISTEQFSELWVSIYSNLVQRGYKCKLFTNGASDDYEYAKSIATRIGDNSVMEDRPNTVKQLVNTISGYKGIIATRMHSAIIAYSYGIPAVGIVWNNKQVMFGESIGRKDYYINYEEFNALYIVDRLIDFLKIGYDDNEGYVQSTSKYIVEFLEQFVV